LIKMGGEILICRGDKEQGTGMAATANITKSYNAVAAAPAPPSVPCLFLECPGGAGAAATEISYFARRGNVCSGMVVAFRTRLFLFPVLLGLPAPSR